MKIISWNLAGMRAAIKKGLWGTMEDLKADVYCFQEVRAMPNQIPMLECPTGYHQFFNPAEKAGYSGVATFSKMEPKSVILGERDNDWDDEGRVIITKFDEFTLLNIYFPNGGHELLRLDYKMKFYDNFLKYINELRDRGEKVVFCGDVNTAHNEIDLARPKDNVKNTGFLPIERAWMDKLEQNGWVDTYRLLNPEKVEYSWWSQRCGCRQKNVGWRIDYFFIDEKLKDTVKSAFILTEVLGSDHCPVGIEINI
ncbi:MAG: exodeoxyribonuclease III [Candidatus Shapirobacteria bacterium]